MKIEELGDTCPQWLREAKTTNADVKLCPCGCGNVEWQGGEWRGGWWLDKSIDRLLYMASMCGITFDASGKAVAWRSTQADGSGRYTDGFRQPEGEYEERDLPPAGKGTCVRGIHVTTQGQALVYFGIDPTAQLWKVTFTREQLLDCDGQKARISGGVFERVAWPFYQPK